MKEQWRSSQPSEQEPPAAQQAEDETSADATIEETLDEKTTRDKELGEIATKGDQRMLEEEAVESGLGYAEAYS